MVREATERKRRALLNARHVIQKERPEQLHHTRVLHRLDRCRTHGEVRNVLRKQNASLLIALKRV